jgi:hypothetical protein
MIKYSKTAPFCFAAFHRFSVITNKLAHPRAQDKSKNIRPEGFQLPDFTQLKIFISSGFSIDDGEPQAYNPR